MPPIYHLILDKGYEIKWKGEYIVAAKEGTELKAYDLIELGALVFLYENKGLSWRVNDDKIDDCLMFLEKRK